MGHRQVRGHSAHHEPAGQHAAGTRNGFKGSSSRKVSAQRPVPQMHLLWLSPLHSPRPSLTSPSTRCHPCFLLGLVGTGTTVPSDSLPAGGFPAPGVHTAGTAGKRHHPMKPTIQLNHKGQIKYLMSK